MIKNLKIFKRARKKEKRKNSKLKISIMGVLLTTIILSVAYINHYNSKYKSHTDTIEETGIVPNTNTDVIPDDSGDIPSKRIVEGDMVWNAITLSSTNCKKFIDEINHIETNYKYEEFYNLNDTIDLYNQNKEKSLNRSGTNIFVNKNSITSSELFQTVKKNNKAYFSENKSGLEFTTYDDISDAELKQVTDVIAKVVNDFILRNKNINIENLGYTLGNLKIVHYATANNAMVRDGNLLIMNPGMIDVLQEMKKDEDAYTMVLTHEIVHLLQGYGEISEYTVVFDHFLTEASAEKLTANYYNTSAITYEAAVSYVDSMNLATMLNDNNTINQTENNSLTNNLDTYFKQFNCTSNQDKTEFLKMSKALTIMHFDDEKFYKNYTVTTGKSMTSEEKKSLNHTLKTYIITTLTKTFYKDLAKQMENQNVPIKDAFYLITLFECDINSHIKYNNEDRKQYNETFIQQYTAIQNSFFYLLSSTNDYTYEEIISMYENYGSKRKDDNKVVENCQLNWLNQDKKNYIQTKYKEKENIGTSSIYVSSKNYTSENTKK